MTASTSAGAAGGVTARPSGVSWAVFSSSRVVAVPALRWSARASWRRTWASGGARGETPVAAVLGSASTGWGSGTGGGSGATRRCGLRGSGAVSVVVGVGAVVVRAGGGGTGALAPARARPRGPRGAPPATGRQTGEGREAAPP